MNIGVLASHEGTTLQAVIDACESGGAPFRVAVVISNNRRSGALRRAAAVSYPAVYLSGRTHPDPSERDAALRETLERHRVDVVLLAGYMKKIGAGTLDRFAGRIINTHPALLPRFGGKGMYGRHVHEAVIDAGEKETGVSVHVVTADYDSGPVIAKCKVPVEPDDTPDSLAARVQARERAFLVEVLTEICEGRLTLSTTPQVTRPGRQP